MGAVMHCLFQFCCDGEEEDDDHRAPTATSSVEPSRMQREHYQAAATEDSIDCCQPVEGETEEQSGVREFLRRLRDRWRVYDSLETITVGEEEEEEDHAATRPIPPSPLRTASTFDSSREIPSIHAEEIVLPGSDLQKAMAKAMSLNLEAHDGDECVICMEGFDPTNPRMPTLCGCGENKAVFHLPCLLQYIEQSRDCPTCRQRLRWEEF